LANAAIAASRAISVLRVQSGSVAVGEQMDLGGVLVHWVPLGPSDLQAGLVSEVRLDLADAWVTKANRDLLVPR